MDYEERRISAIKHILSKVRSGGQALIYCWALEQGNSRRGYHEGMEQDVLVPWVLQEKKKKEPTKKQSSQRAKPDLTNVAPQDRAAFVANWKKEQEQLRLKRKKQSRKMKNKKKMSNIGSITYIKRVNWKKIVKQQVL